jgi:hypothetical protein
MTPLVLYCKSYSTDLFRLVRLAESVRKFNVDRLPFYVSVPRTELPLFYDYLQGLEVNLLADEEIIEANPRIDCSSWARLPGNIGQQIVKSEFWRLSLADSYLCLDSDSIFIRPFFSSDYINADGTPYTVINEAQDLLSMSILLGKLRVVDDFHREASRVQKLFNRNGKAYSFGPMPMVWHRLVWESLDTFYLLPKGINFMDAIQLAPLESRWYGETLLKYEAIRLMPAEPFFKVYHYAWQCQQDARRKIGKLELSSIYSGIVYQSAWEREMDWPSEGGNKLSWLARRLRRKLGRV